MSTICEMHFTTVEGGGLTLRLTDSGTNFENWLQFTADPPVLLSEFDCSSDQVACIAAADGSFDVRAAIDTDQSVINGTLDGSGGVIMTINGNSLDLPHGFWSMQIS